MLRLNCSHNHANPNPSTSSRQGILWGAVAAAVGASVAEWQKKREEEERRKVAEMLAAAERGTSKSAKAKYEAMMKHKRIVGESQGLLDKKYAEQKAQKNAQESTHNHLMNEHKSQQSVYVSKQQQEDDEAFEEAWRKEQREKAAETLSSVIAAQSVQRQDEENGIKPIYKLGLSELVLVNQYQQNQGQTNYCGSYAISTALNMLYGTKTTGLDVIDVFAQNYFGLRISKAFPILSWLPNGAAVLPYQQSLIINNYSSEILKRQNNLPNASTQDLSVYDLNTLIEDPNKAVLLTYNTIPDDITSGHVIVLAAYDPIKGYGFLNSGADRPVNWQNELTWKTVSEMQELLNAPIGLESSLNPNFVVVTKP